MFYVNRMIQHFTARQEIPTAAVHESLCDRHRRSTYFDSLRSATPRNDIYGGTVRNGKINIKLPQM